MRKHKAFTSLLGALALGSVTASAGSFSSSFESGVPPGSGVYGSAVVESTGGFNGSGCLKLTKALGNQQGSFILDDLDPGGALAGLDLAFKVRVGGGTPLPADGFSVCLAPAASLPNGTLFGEDGITVGLVLSFDVYDNGSGEAPAIEVKWNNTIVSSVKVPLAFISTGDGFVPVSIHLDPDGTVDLTYNGVVIHKDTLVPGFTPIVGARIALGGRTGGAYANQWIDDLSITTVPPGFTFTKQPASKVVYDSAQFVLSVAVADPTGVTYQWQSDYQGTSGWSDEPGATDPSFTNQLFTFDSGTLYRCIATLGGQSLTSAVATLTVMDASALARPGAPDASYDFNTGLPGGTAIYGNSLITNQGGVSDSGCLVLTYAVGSQNSAFLAPDLKPGKPTLGFTAAFKVYVGGGTANPADGFSFNWASDLPTGVYGGSGAEEGAGTGLTVSFDTYDNTDGNPLNEAGEAPAIDIKWGGQPGVVASTRVPLELLTNETFIEIVIRLKPDGTLDLACNNQIIYWNQPVPGYRPLWGARFGLGARTGGAYANQWFDDVALAAVAGSDPAYPPVITSQPQSLTATRGRPATFSVTAVGALPLSYQWLFNGAPLGGATSATLTLPGVTDAQAGAYQVVVTNVDGAVTSLVATLTVQPFGSAFFDFNTPGQFTNNFALSIAALYTPFTYIEAASGGVNSTRCVDYTAGAAGTDTTAVLTNLAYDFSYHGAVLKCAMMVKVKAPSSNNRLLQIGFLNRPSTLTGERLTAFMSARVNSTAQPALTYALQTQSKTTVGTGTIDGTQTGTTNLTAGNWYLLTVAFNNIKATTANSYTVTATFQDMGATGLTPGATVLTVGPVTTAVADLVNDNSVYFAFRGFDNAGADALDNAAVVVTEGAATVAGSPTNRTLLEGRPTAFYAYVDGTPPFTYQWRSNGVPLPGATDWFYALPAVTTNADGAAYDLVVNGAVTSGAGTLTVTPDTFPPVLLSAGSFDGFSVGVAFDEPVDPASATTPANYSILGGPTVNNVILRPDGRTVLLLMNGGLSGAFTVQVTGVKDRFNNAMGTATAGGTVQSQLTSLDLGGALPPGSVYTWKDGDFEITAGGADIWDNTDRGRFTLQPVTGDFDVKVLITDEQFAAGSGGQIVKAGLAAREDFTPGSRVLHAYVMPPFPGLNRYETGVRDVPYGATVGWGVDPTGDVATLGNIGANHPNSWLRLRRVGHTFVAYSGTNGQDWRVLSWTNKEWSSTLLVGLMQCSHVQGLPASAKFLNYGPFPGYPGVSLTWLTNVTPTSVTVPAGAPMTFTVAALLSNAPPGEILFAWQRSDGVGGWTNMPAGGAFQHTNFLSPYFLSALPASTNIHTLVTPVLSSADNGAQFRCIARVGGGALTSAVATVTVADTAGPNLVSATVPPGSTNRVMLLFSEPLNPATATVAGNYTVTNASGVSMGVASATILGADPRTVVLITASPLVAGSYGVVVTGVQDPTGNPMGPNNVAQFRSFDAPAQPVVIEMYQDIGSATDINSMVTNAMFTGGMPTFVVYSNLFGFNMVSGFASSQDSYGVKAYTWFVPPTNGNYKFWIRSDDLLELYLSTNGTDWASDVVVAYPNDGTGSVAERARYAVDNSRGSKYLNTVELNTGFYVTPAVGPTVVTGMRFTSANDAAERDPMTFTLEGSSTAGTNGPWTLIASGGTGLTTTRLETAPAVTFANSTPYTSYRVIFPTVRDSGAATAMQIAEVELLNASGVDVLSSKTLIARNTGANGTYTVGTTPANSITNLFLLAGQPYHLEALLKEGTGGDGFSVAVRPTGDLTAPNAIESIDPAFLAFPTPAVPPLPAVVELYTVSPPGTTLTGSDLPSLYAATNSGAFQARLPNVVAFQKYLAVQPVSAPNTSFINTRYDNYLGRLYTFYVAPSNGLYRFWIRSDDSSQLWMNTNGNPALSTDPAGVSFLGERSGATFAYVALAQNVPLNGGQRYYLEARWKEGTGGDGVAVAIRAQSDSATPPNSELIPVSQLAYPSTVDRLGAVSVAGLLPINPTVVQGRAVTFTAYGVAGSANALNLYWLRNGVPVAAAAGSYTTPPLQPGDSGTVFTLLVSNSFSVVTLSSTVTVLTDSTPPVPTSVSGHLYHTNVILTFAEPVLPLTATNLANYQIPGLTILAAYLDPTATRVSLRTTPQTPGATYSLTVGGLADQSAGNVLGATTIPFTAWNNSGCDQGYVMIEVFTNITGTAIANLTGDAKFLNNVADTVLINNRLEYRTAPPLLGNGVENYGVRMSGYFVAPSNGTYRFYIRGDDATQLWMNTNSVGSTNPAGKVLLVNVPVAGWSYGSGTNVSPNVDMTAGQACYFEAYVKEGGGGDYLTMTFREAGVAGNPPDSEVGPATFFALPHNNPGDVRAPVPVRTYSLSGHAVVVEFDEFLQQFVPNVDMGDPFNYEVSDGVGSYSVAAVTLRADGRSLLLDLAGTLAAPPFAVTMSMVLDPRCNVFAGTVGGGPVFALGQGLRDDVAVHPYNTDPIEKGGVAVDVNQLAQTAGGSDIWGNADGMRYAYGFYTGDFDLRVRVESLTPRNVWTKCGLMARETLANGSRHVTALVTPAAVSALDNSGVCVNVYQGATRAATDGASSEFATRTAGVPYPNAWIRLRRVGDTLLCYLGSNGVDWVQFGSTTPSPPFPPTVLVGPAVTSHNNAAGQTATGVLRDYSLITPPTIVTNPIAATVLAGQTATFGVLADGTGPLFYQWRLNGTPLPGATNPVLVLAGARWTNEGAYDVVVTNVNSAVLSAPATLTVIETDFGDAPDPTYPTWLANNGARHTIVPGYFLGAGVDGELDGQPNATATGDDLSVTDDEDGVLFNPPASGNVIYLGLVNSIVVTASAPGFIDAWADVNFNGSWADAGEQILVSVPLAAGPNVFPVPVPGILPPGKTMVRFRFSSAGGLGFTGAAPDGEVEDYEIEFVTATDLQVTKAAAPSPVEACAPITYTLEVTNAGPAQATSVTVTDVLPPTLAFVSASPGCTHAAGTVTCALGTLNVGAAAQVVIVATALTNGPATNLAAVAALQSDPAPGNNAVAVVTPVVDTTPPVITTCPAERTLTIASGCTINAPDLVSEAAAHDGCMPAALTQSPVAGTPLSPGTNLVTITATDGVGQTDTCTVAVKVIETVAPVITCPADQVAETSDANGAVVTFAPTATDNCDANPAIACVPASGSVFPVGRTNVVCTAWDVSGNSNACSFQVTVLLCETTNVLVGTDIPDDDASGVASTVVLSTPLGNATDVNVSLVVTGGWNGDLYAWLTHESGFAVLLNRVGKRAGSNQGYSDAGVEATFDDQAPNGDVHVYRLTLNGSHTVPLGGPLTNSWAPDGRATDPADVLDTDARTEVLGSFNTLNPNGEWTLFIADVSGGDVSHFVSWSLQVCGTFDLRPTITVPPVDTTVNCRSNAVFNVTATGTAPFSYQWYFGPTLLAGETASTLTLNNVALSQAGAYTVVVSNIVCAVTSAPAVLTVVNTNPPVILTQPQDTLVTVGGTANFSVTADSCTEMTYQWFHGPNPVTDGTNATLVITNVQVADGGSYYVVVSNSGGSTPSAAAILTVNLPPVALNDGGATTENTPLSIAIAKLLYNDSDPDGDPVSFVSAASPSLNGGTVTVAAGRVNYTPPAGFTGLDRYSYTISDGRGGTASGEVEVYVVSGVLPGLNQVALQPVGGGFLVRFAGIPGYTYQLQRSTDLVNWGTIATPTAPVYGIIEYLDANPPQPSAFYRTIWP